ncbi:MAG TPA: hypothetical protein VGS80_13765, partial [Ktedonobacterales bacterium]|nr:hypothetical protein [Ktedonobacterales bacterium]
MGERPDELSTAPSAPTPGTTDRPTLVDLDEELTRPRVSARRRAAQTGVVLAAVVVVVVGLLLHGIGPAQQQGTSVVQPLAPPTVLIESNVSFGTLTLNGQALHGSPPLLTARFHLGTNVVTLAAPPFAPKTCHFLLPSDHPSAETGCSGGGTAGGPIAIQGVSVVPDQILDIELGSAGLPPEL